MTELIKRICFYIEIKADRIKSKARLRKMKIELSNLQWELFIRKREDSEETRMIADEIKRLNKAIEIEQLFTLDF